MSRHTVTCAGGGDSNWPIVPDCALRRCTTGFMLSHKLSVSQYSHLALALRLAQRHCAAVRGRARPPELRGNSVAANRHFFFVRSVRSSAAGLGPDRPAARARAALCYQADGIGPTRQPRPPRCSRWRRAVQVRSLCNPATAVSTSGQWCLQHQERRKSAARHAQR